MADHRKRFERWYKGLPKNTAYLVDQVLSRVVPEFERRDFVWHPDFAGGDATQIGANDIPLQRRRGEVWPTVQILFDKRRRPSFGMSFSALPSICKRWKKDAYIDIPREIALVFEGPVTFALCKGPNGTCQYGYRWFSVFPRRCIDSEIERFLALLPEVFHLFDEGIPADWLQRKFGHVTEHVLLVDSRASAFGV